MKYDELKNQITAEIANKKANNKLLEKIAIQLKKTEKAEACYLREKEKLEKLVAEKEALQNGTTATQSKQE